MGEDEPKYTSIGLIAMDAARVRHPLQPAASDTKQDILNALREVTAKQFLALLSAYVKLGKLKAVNPYTGAPFDPDLPILDAGDALWSVSNSERERALELLGQREPAKAAPLRPAQALAAQEEAILAQLSELNVQPLALPKTAPGRAGVKAQVRTAIGKTSLFQSKVVFNKAWQRLRNSGTIADVLKSR